MAVSIVRVESVVMSDADCEIATRTIITAVIFLLQGVSRREDLRKVRAY